jgi:hypothetical protein
VLQKKNNFFSYIVLLGYPDLAVQSGIGSEAFQWAEEDRRFTTFSLLFLLSLGQQAIISSSIERHRFH